MHRLFTSLPSILTSLFGGVFVLVLILLPSAAFADEDVHIVQPGDTLSEIAEQYGTDMDTLRALNNLNNVDFVWAGQRLTLPGNAATSAENPSDSRVDDIDTVTYIVQPGDTLWGISISHRTSLAWLAVQNRIYPGQRLIAGRELIVPVVPVSLTGASLEGERYHIVEAGESVGSIANLYNTTAAAIIRANDFSNPNQIVPGQEIKVVPPEIHERMGTNASVDENGFLVYTEYPTTTEKWIAVDLSEQRVTAYEGTTPVKAFIVSTGLPNTPTVTGSFRIWAKTPLQDMYGGNRAGGTYYYLRNVPWVQYFYEDYAFHGTTWHANFGRTASRGCINMSPSDAEWLFKWAEPDFDGRGWFISDEENPGTLVIVHQ